MAKTKKCPKCAGDVRRDAIFCGHCGYEFTADDFRRARLADERKPKLWAGVAMVALLFLALGLIRGVDDKPPAEPARNAIPAARVRADPAPIAAGVYQPYTRDQFPKAFALWGKDGIARVQKLREEAAATAARNPQCDAVELSELSDSRSTPPVHPVVFVDCRNIQRFYITEADVGGAVSSERQKGARFSKSDLIERCTQAVMARLNVPRSFDRNLFSASDRQEKTGERVINFNFEAKNRMGVALPASAHCVVAPSGKLDVTISE